MRKVAYCAAGTFVSVAISDEDYRAFLARQGDSDPGGEDMREPCATLEHVVARVRDGAPATVSPAEAEAACRIWRFCNSGSETIDDVVVVDYVGDGKSVEFAPLAELPCCGNEQSTCVCRRERTELAEPAFSQ